MMTGIQKAIGGAVAGVALLGLAVPAIAHNHNQSAPSSASETIVTQAPTAPSVGQMQQRMEGMPQMNQMMQHCNSMMNMMQNRMNNGNMPGMMNPPQGQPGQGMMNRTSAQ